MYEGVHSLFQSVLRACLRSELSIKSFETGKFGQGKQN
jgi:hypothetical protein